MIIEATLEAAERKDFKTALTLALYSCGVPVLVAVGAAKAVKKKHRRSQVIFLLSYLRECIEQDGSCETLICTIVKDGQTMPYPNGRRMLNDILQMATNEGFSPEFPCCFRYPADHFDGAEDLVLPLGYEPFGDLEFDLHQGSERLQ